MFAVSKLDAQQSGYSYDAPGNLASVTETNNFAPIIITQPQSVMFFSNAPVTLSIVAAGAGLLYQWRSNGVVIVGATNDSLVFFNLVGVNLTNFTVVISNTAGMTITSTPVAIWADSNGNGIPDWWEIQYFGNLNQRADGDFDGDGVSNIAEYREGTIPNNASSFNPRLFIQKANLGLVVASPDQLYYTNGQIVTLSAMPDTGQDFLGWSGAASGTKTEIALVMTGHKTVAASFGIPVPVALDNTNLVWTTGGSTPWFGQTQFTEDGTNAAQSGTITINQQSWLQTIETNLNQNARLDFWWNVSSQPPDGTTFALDGTVVASLSGQAVGWQHFQTNLLHGIHTLLWTYSKANIDQPVPTGIPFTDSAWVDQATVTLLPTPPIITTNPVSQTVPSGAGAQFSVTAIGSQPLSYQWYSNHLSQVNATNTSFQLNPPQPSLSTVFAVVTNAFGAVTSSVATLAVTTLSCSSAPSGLIGWWSGEGNLIDAVGGRNGTSVNGLSYATGMVGEAFNLNGGYIEVSNSAAFNFGPTSPMSVELWAYRTGSASIMHFLGKRDGCAGSIQYQMAFDTSGVGFGGSSGGATVPWQLPLNTWVHLAGTFDGTTFRFYTNGLLAATGAGTIGPTAVAPLRIGVSGSCSQTFIGSLDEVSIYNRALTSNEIASIYLTSIHGKCAYLTAPLAFQTASSNFQLTASGLQLSFPGASVQRPIEIDASSNLINWLPIYTNAPPFGPFLFLDSDATNFSKRFYRAVINQ